MKRMTDTELDARIAQFMDRKKEDFPGLFSGFEASRDTQRALPHAKRGLSSL